MKYIDIHSHLNMPEFEIDLDETIIRAGKKEVGIIVVGVNKSSSEKAVKLARENKNIWACIGLHPADDPNETFEYNFYKNLASDPKVVAIGECGFDYYHRPGFDKDRQKAIFEKHIALANELNKPLMLHIRNGMNGENAYADALDTLSKHAKVHGNVHFFSGNEQQAHSFIKLGFRVSFTGVITFARDYDEVIKKVPLNMIMTETDSPFVTPAPFRGQRNEPSFVVEVANKIADIRGEDREFIRQQLLENAIEVFDLK